MIYLRAKLGHIWHIADFSERPEGAGLCGFGSLAPPAWVDRIDTNDSPEAAPFSLCGKCRAIELGVMPPLLALGPGREG